ncbi:MAG TPA: hypothetical protein VJ851_05520 [Jatrophihabitans sp.]|nr:hypothetical protein [Jatrophihabitans sp.]
MTEDRYVATAIGRNFGRIDRNVCGCRTGGGATGCGDNTNLECQPIGNQQLSCDLYKSGKDDYVSTTTWELYGSYYASDVNFLTINCPAPVVGVSASWTDSSNQSRAEFLRVWCY